MPDVNVVADVSETLRHFLATGLQSALGTDFQAVLHDLHGNPPGPKTLSVFLYELIEDPSARNRPRVREILEPPENGRVRISKPPVALLLRYLLTPYATAPQTAATTTLQMIGAVVKLLYDTPILAGSDLTGGLQNTSEAVKITMAPLSLEDRTRVWHAVQQPYRLSLAYEARVVNITPEPGAVGALVNTRDVRSGNVERVP